MSYGIVRIAKMTGGAVKGIEMHDERKKDVSHTNKDINWSKSNLNYSLHDGEKNYTKSINKKVSALNLPKAVRKDAIKMVQVLVTSDSNFFQNLSEEKQREFFKRCYGFISDRYGKKNVISANVHLDEKTPHMHLNFAPITVDGRLCAKDIFRYKTDLSKLHDEFFKNVGKDFGLERGEPGGNKKHLEVAEFKLQTAKSELGPLEKEKNQLFQKIGSLTEDLYIMEMSVVEIKKIKPRGGFGGLKDITLEQVENLKANAIQGITARTYLSKILPEYEKMKKNAPTLKQKVEEQSKISELKNKTMFYENKFSKMQEIFKQNPKLADDFEKAVTKFNRSHQQNQQGYER